MSLDQDALNAQSQHWQTTFNDNPEMYGTDLSASGSYAIDLFKRERLDQILELGAGQGRDTLPFLRSGLALIALDYAPDALAEIAAAADASGLTERLNLREHDVRHPLPLPADSVDAVYSHMLFNMAMSKAELSNLAKEVHRVLRPGGWHVYTVRHTGDAHYKTGVPRGENLTENGGFIVHFFDRPMVELLSDGFSAPEIVDFEEGGLPRRLWRITQRKTTETSNANYYKEISQ